MRPRSSVGRGNSISMSTSASSPYSCCASLSEIWVDASVTSSTIFLTANSSSWPDSWLNRARRASVLYRFRAAASIASWSAVMMMSGSTPFSFAMASICCNNGLTVAIKLSAVGVLPPALEAGAAAQPNANGIVLSKLDCQLAALDQRDRHPMASTSFLGGHGAALDGNDAPREGRRAVDGRGRDPLGQPPGEPPIIRLVPEWPIQPR